MAAIHACKINEYKTLNDVLYVLVEWSDKSISWTRLNSLKNKDLAVAFFKKAISLIKQEIREADEKLRKEEEAEMLNKIISGNLKTSQKVELAQKKISNQLLNEIRQPGFSGKQQIEETCVNMRQMDNKKDFNNLDKFNLTKQSKLKNSDQQYSVSHNQKDNTSFAGLRNIKPLNQAEFPSLNVISGNINNSFAKSNESSNLSKNINFPVQKINFEIFQNKTQDQSECLNQRIKRQAISKFKSNSISMKIDDIFKIQAEFHFNDTFSSLSFESTAICFVSMCSIYPYLYSLFLMENNDFGVYPSVEIIDQTDSDLDKVLLESNSLITGLNNEFYWMIHACKPNQYLFRKDSQSKYLIIRAQKNNFLSGIIKPFPLLSDQSLWVKDSFGFGINILTNSMYSGYILPASKNIFIFGCKNSYLGIYLFKYLSLLNNITTNFLEADLIVIQELYLSFLHRIPYFYDSLKSKRKFFLQSGSSFQEILIKGGFITFSDEFLLNCELLVISDILEAISTKNTWEIKVTRDLYNIIKRRLTSQSTLPDFIPKVKSIYRVFKNNLVTKNSINLINDLEKEHFRTHRFFIEISSFKTNEFSYTFEEAMMLISSN